MAVKENNFYFDSFAKGIAFANEAAVLLHVCCSNGQHIDAQSYLGDMHGIEHTADGVKHKMMERLMKEFLPPIEREDIVQLARTIDDVTDAIEDVLRSMYMYNVTVLRPDIQEFTTLIVKCCSVLSEASREFINFRKSGTLSEKLIEVNALEEEGDRLHLESVRRLYTEEDDPVAIISWSTIYNRLEKCCDCCEDVADMIEQVVMKNS